MVAGVSTRTPLLLILGHDWPEFRETVRLKLAYAVFLCHPEDSVKGWAHCKPREVCNCAEGGTVSGVPLGEGTYQSFDR